MEKRGLVSYEVTKEDRIYRFIAPMGVPLGECFDACFMVLDQLAKDSQEVVNKNKPQENKDAQPIEVKPIEEPKKSK